MKKSKGTLTLRAIPLKQGHVEAFRSIIVDALSDVYIEQQDLLLSYHYQLGKKAAPILTDPTNPHSPAVVLNDSEVATLIKLQGDLLCILQGKQKAINSLEQRIKELNASSNESVVLTKIKEIIVTNNEAVQNKTALGLADTTQPMPDLRLVLESFGQIYPIALLEKTSGAGKLLRVLYGGKLVDFPGLIKLCDRIYGEK